MATDYHHGVRVIEIDDGTRPIRTVETGIIGVVGTAPDADNAVFPLDVPVLIIGARTKAARLDTTGKGRGTLPGVMDAIFDQIAPLIVVVRVADAATEKEQISRIIGTVDATQLLLYGFTTLIAKLHTANSLAEVREAAAPFAHLSSGFLAKVEAGEVKLPFMAKGLDSVVSDIEQRATAVAEVLQSATNGD